jgi:hypothetical protein
MSVWDIALVRGVALVVGVPSVRLMSARVAILLRGVGRLGLVLAVRSCCGLGAPARLLGLLQVLQPLLLCSYSFLELLDAPLRRFRVLDTPLASVKLLDVMLWGPLIGTWLLSPFTVVLLGGIILLGGVQRMFGIRLSLTPIIDRVRAFLRSFGLLPRTLLSDFGLGLRALLGCLRFVPCTPLRRFGLAPCIRTAVAPSPACMRGRYDERAQGAHTSPIPWRVGVARHTNRARPQ